MFLDFVFIFFIRISLDLVFSVHIYLTKVLFLCLSVSMMHLDSDICFSHAYAYVPDHMHQYLEPLFIYILYLAIFLFHLKCSFILLFQLYFLRSFLLIHVILRMSSISRSRLLIVTSSVVFLVKGSALLSSDLTKMIFTISSSTYSRTKCRRMSMCLVR